MKSSKKQRKINRKSTKRESSKRKLSKRKLSKRELSKKRVSNRRTITDSSSKEVPLKDRSLIDKIIIGICLFILIVFPAVTIIVTVSLAIYTGISGIIDEKEYHTEKRESNEDLYGKYLYLDEIGEDVYKVVSEDQDPEKRLEWNEEFCGYYDDLSDGYVWYDVKREQWRYWFNGISSDYKDYGWMVYKPEGWRIQKDDVDWIKLPEKYDRSKLWYIKQED